VNDLAHLRVLLVEDNQLDARTMQRLLSADGDTRFDVQHVEDLKSALEALAVDSIDCVLLDLSLPDASGLHALDETLAASAHVPVVVLTGLDDPATAIEAVDRGANDYLPKGDVNGDLVARSVRYAVARHHSDTEMREATKQLELAHDRERIAQDLHDTVVQQLFATGMGLQALAGFLDDSHRKSIFDAVDNIDHAIRQLREAIFDLHASAEPVTDGVRELEALVEEQSAVLGFHPTFTKQNVSDLPDSLLHEARAVVQEALANAAKYAKATALEVRVSTDADEFTVEVVDNGVGIDPGASDDSNPGLTGNGIRNLEKRAAAAGGQFTIEPGPSGGTRVRWSVPLSAFR